MMSMAKVEAAIDYWVDRYDPDAVRRVELSSRGRHVDVFDEHNGSGVAYVDGKLFSHDAAALDKRLDAMAQCVMAIRAPLSSAALTHWGRWRMAATGWPAGAGPQSVRPQTL
jgi:uncharacterized protein DUF222